MSGSIVAWRIVKARRAAENPFDGEGARLYGGRWNSPGTALVYTAESRALALLETLVHLPAAGLLGLFVCIPVRFEETVVRVLPEAELPADWRQGPAPASTRRLGDDWVAARRGVVLRVPSVVVPPEANYLLNPAHPDFARTVTVGEPEEVRFDPRLVKGR